MKNAVSLGIILAALAGPAQVHADPYTVLPDGSVVFNTALSTQGVFLCAAASPCAGGGTSNVVIGSGDEAIAISFTGVQTTFAVGNTAEPVTLGNFSVTTARTTFPFSGNVHVPILGFQLTLTHEQPVAGTTSRTYGLGPGGGETLMVLTGADWFGLPLGANPPGFRYTSIVYSLEPFPFSLDINGSTPLTAEVGVVPEPGTLLLVGSGLALAAARRRALRRRPGLETPPLKGA